uniref:Uncharacterized protein n=1 Tax=Clastoptera arizonana TaxID=38151 RepID=A0A1B6CDM1_9HEMI
MLQPIIIIRSILKCSEDFKMVFAILIPLTIHCISSVGSQETLKEVEDEIYIKQQTASALATRIVDSISDTNTNEGKQYKLLVDLLEVQGEKMKLYLKFLKLKQYSEDSEKYLAVKNTLKSVENLKAIGNSSGTAVFLKAEQLMKDVQNLEKIFQS